MTEDESGDRPNADIYRAPDAELLAEPGLEPEFYVVAPRKFLLLYLGTWGLYEVYWFYRHWRLYRDWHDLKLWPVPRAIFSIIFAYPLFRRIANRGSETGSGQWSAGWYAVAYVVLYMVGNFSEFPKPGPNSVIQLASTMIPMFLLAALLYRVQRCANLACGDSDGESNCHYTGVNYLWLLVGTLLWLGTLATIAELFGFVEFGG